MQYHISYSGSQSHYLLTITQELFPGSNEFLCIVVKKTLVATRYRYA